MTLGSRWKQRNNNVEIKILQKSKITKNTYSFKVLSTTTMWWVGYEGTLSEGTIRHHFEFSGNPKPIIKQLEV